MFNQRERSLDDLLDEVRQLRDRMKGILPSYTALLKEVSQLPEGFEYRFWASCVEALLEKVKVDYQKYQAQVQKADLWGKSVTLMADIVLKAGGMEPMPLLNSLRIGVSIHPSGKIEPALFDDTNRQPDAIFVTFDQFEVITQRLKSKLLKGTVMPANEGEIPKLVYSLAAEQK